MRYEQKQIDLFLAEAKTSTMDILDLSKKHGIHPHTGSIWARKFLPKKMLEAIRVRGRRIRALHAAATRTARLASASLEEAPVKVHATPAMKTGTKSARGHSAGSHAKAVAVQSGHKGGRTGRQALATLKARLLAMLDDVSKMQAAGA